MKKYRYSRDPIYGHSLALLTDLYQLTMAHGYWKLGREEEAVFHLHFRKNPFRGGYAVACGLGQAIDLLSRLRFDDDDVAYLATLNGADDKPLFEPDFLAYLSELEFRCDVDAVPEGTVVFPFEPLIRVRGPLLQCQILETPLLTLVNFPTLVATKATRITQLTRDEPVLEFGLRRAQGIDGSLAASRAAFVGGCGATSNVLAGKLFDMPVRGTHAHSWVMSFDDEEESFEAYARAMPNNCVFLVDTYDTIEGVKKAVRVGLELRRRGHEMVGIRLDSGDLAELSIEARRILDAGGFPDAAIVASSDLDEYAVAQLKERGATIGVWGIGTKLATAYDQPALGGVYKLSAIRGSDGEWQHKVKLSEEPIKVSTPGLQQIRRYRDGGRFVADVIYDETTGLAAPPTLVDLADLETETAVEPATQGEDLLVPIFRGGELVYDPPSLRSSQRRARDQLAALGSAVTRLTDAGRYPVGLDRNLAALKSRLMEEVRQAVARSSERAGS